MDNFNDIHKAAETGDIDKIEEILNKYPDNIEKTDSTGLTPLGTALYSSQPETLQFLLNNGASKNAEGRDGKKLLQWAAEQENNETAGILMAWDYIDRLYETSKWWVSSGVEKSICDSCAGTITHDTSIMMSLDESFTSKKYSDKVIEQALKYQPQGFSNKSREELIEYIKTIIKDSSKRDNYIVCTECIDKFFSSIIFGKNRDFIIETVDTMMNETDEDIEPDEAT